MGETDPLFRFCGTQKRHVRASLVTLREVLLVV
jgi:hypothetical protein